MDTLADIGHDLADGTADPVALTETALARACAAEHVFIAVFEDGARADAKASDRGRRGLGICKRDVTR
jgi:Asp-tRNA(Asn)/Glu-tRNA(Gln) amidotransferase A subunit family amidase